MIAGLLYCFIYICQMRPLPLLSGALPAASGDHPSPLVGSGHIKGKVNSVGWRGLGF
jgi:hypothetical protein